MRHSIAIPIALAICSCLLSPACNRQPDAGTTVAPPAATQEWQLPPGLKLQSPSMDVSSDRKWAVIWGEQKAGASSRRSCWLVDLETGRIDDLRAVGGGENTAALRDPKRAVFSPDGRYVAIENWTDACIIDPAKVKVVGTIREPESAWMMWAGDRLLFSAEGKPIAAYDVTGQAVGALDLKAFVVGSDPTGRKLLAWHTPRDPMAKPEKGPDDPITAVIAPDGRVLREIASLYNVCDKVPPMLSRRGNWVAVVDTMALSDADTGGVSGVYIRVVSLPTGKVIRVKPWAFPLALTETGEGVLLRRSQDNGDTIEFWNTQGKCRTLVDSAVDGTILGDELFYVQRLGDILALKAMPLPKS